MERMQNLPAQPSGQTSRKNGESYGSAISWLGTRTSFEISPYMCTRVQNPFLDLFTRTHADFLDVLVVLVLVF